MAFYLRDQHIKNISLDADSLTQINSIFEERLTQLQIELDKNSSHAKKAFLTYIIRFDNKGYRVFSIEELLRYYNQAKNIERIIFTIESSDALSSNRTIGDFLELCLDVNEESRCTLVSSSNSKDWTEASFASVHEFIGKCQTNYGLARNVWTNLGVQILGVVFGFIFSLYIALKVSPKITIENSFTISFLFTLLVFSNIWGYLSQALLGLASSTFPNIEFSRPVKNRIHWLMQAIIGSSAFALTFYFSGAAVSFLYSFLSDSLAH